jgi:hypothetical protein
MSDILIEKFCTELLQRKLGFLVQIYAGYSKQDQFKILGLGAGSEHPSNDWAGAEKHYGGSENECRKINHS